MVERIPCSHCQTPAIAEIDGDYVCAGCLMSILMCLEETLPVHPLDVSLADTKQETDGRDTLNRIYSELG